MRNFGDFTRQAPISIVVLWEYWASASRRRDSEPIMTKSLVESQKKSQPP